jgi:4-hydroxybenzoate polyprenyltransferase
MQQGMDKDHHHIADATPQGWVDTRAPRQWRPFLRLARYDRPIGFWLLAIPCWVGMALAHLDRPWTQSDFVLALAFWIGALAMRGAGCTYNDIVDRDLDAKVSRTALRPIASGAVSVKTAWAFLLLQCLVGLGVLIILPAAARLVALAAIPLILAYPYMKRITFWPQAWLGLTFNWGVLVGYVAIAGTITPALLLAYAGLFFWTLGYDTIYAHQDKEDDALIGVKSTARLFGGQTKLALTIIYAAALLLLAFAGVRETGVAPDQAALVGSWVPTLVFAFFLSEQITKTNFDDQASCLHAFKQNKIAGLVYVALLALSPTLLGLVLGATGG